MNKVRKETYALVDQFARQQTSKIENNVWYHEIFYTKQVMNIEELTLDSVINITRNTTSDSVCEGISEIIDDE